MTARAIYVLEIEEEDNSPTGFPDTLKVSNSTLIDNGDGTFSLTNLTGGGVGGSDTQVQFNDGGSFGGDAGFVYNKTTNKLTLGDIETTATTGITIPSTSAYGFVRSGDPDTGVFFNVTNTRYEFHRDGSGPATISAESTPTFSFRSTIGSTGTSLAVPDEAYVFSLDSNRDTGLYFTLAGGSAEWRLDGSVTHTMNVVNGTYDLTGDMRASQLMADGDTGGTASTNTYTGTADVSANSTGIGTIKMKGTTSRDSAGFIKVYAGTTAVFIPAFTAITG